MAQTEILLPKMGESVAEATIIKWLVEEGQQVEADEPIVEIATDKVDSEVPAPEDGVLIKMLVSEGDVVAVGQPIAIFGQAGDSAATPAAAPSEKGVALEATPEAEVLEAVGAPLSNGAVVQKTGPSGRFYSPLVRSIAKEEGIAMSELEVVNGSGSEGRVTKKDILAYVANRGNVPAATAAPVQVAASSPSVAAPNVAAPKPRPASKISVGPNDEIVEMDRMRKMIADHMVSSVQTSPHVTSFVEADVTNVVNWRLKMKKEFEEREGERLTFTPIFIEAVAKAIKDFPGVNASVDGDRVIIRKDINIGMAAALPSGNLIVPVIRNADRYNMVGLAKAVNDLAGKAKTNKLSPDDIQGGTYTVSNVGTFGNVMGTPIINQPQVAILALGAIRKKPAVLETPDGDVLAVRHMMFLSHSYDHRVVDGMLGGSFVRRVADYLEQFDVNRALW
ncbi:MAG: 2-oxoglutarate dehydrogenase E2 component (dihydrolipoamide succinyltransferase) [Flavobacteriales bacterium]|jgi:2-oxoglutarate dehydrogenase E2 component (dihydrolipoamide succinyltransferase)